MNKLNQTESMTQKIIKNISILTLGFLFVPVFIAFAQDDGHTDHSHAPVTTSVQTSTGNIGYTEEADVTEGVVVNLTVSPNPKVGSPTKLEFFVRDGVSGKPITNLEIEHDKYIHVIGVRDDMNEFLHIHPKEVSPGKWVVDYVFTKPGKYKLWSDVRHEKATKNIGHPFIVVAGSGERSEPQSRLVKNAVVGKNFQIAIDHSDNIEAGEATEIHFIVKNVFGETVELEPYLGAQMHVAVLKNDLLAYIHAHPDDSSHGHGESMDEIMEEHMEIQTRISGINFAYAHVDEDVDRTGTEVPFLVTFPLEGSYRLYAQFRPLGINLPEGTSLVASFDVNVKAGSSNSAPLSQVDPKLKWWSLLIISLILMSLLSYGVYQYIRPK